MAKFAQMDCTDQIDNLKALGRAVANAYVNINLFQGFDEEVKATEGIAAN